MNETQFSVATVNPTADGIRLLFTTEWDTSPQRIEETQRQLLRAFPAPDYQIVRYKRDARISYQPVASGGAS